MASDVSGREAMWARVAAVLLWVLGCAALIQTIFVTLPFFAQGVASASPDALGRGLVHHRFLGDFGFVVALVVQTFGYTLLAPLAVVSAALSIVKRRWVGLAITLCSMMPWVVLLPYHGRLVDWLWI